MKYIIIVLLFILSACGSRSDIIQVQLVNEDLDAVYYFPLGGTIEVTQDQYDRVTIVMLDYLTSINPSNTTYGEHPRTNITDQYLDASGSLHYSVNVTYGSGDLENDTTGVDIVGSKRTDFIFTWSNNYMMIEIKIFEAPKNNNVNSVIARRIITGTK